MSLKYEPSSEPLHMVLLPIQSNLGPYQNLWVHTLVLASWFVLGEKQPEKEVGREIGQSERERERERASRWAGTHLLISAPGVRLELAEVDVERVRPCFML